MLRRRHRALQAALVVVLVLAAGAVALAAGVTGGDGVTRLTAGSSGVVRLVNAQEGRAVVAASDLRPGTSRTGTVEIRNDGSQDAALRLTPGAISDIPGANGGRLSQVLQMRLEQLHPRTGPAVVYDGSLAELPSASLGTLAPGDARNFRFTVRFPDGGVPATPRTGDNAYQGSAVGVTYTWSQDTAFTDASGRSPGLSLIGGSVQSRVNLFRRGVRLTIECQEPCSVLSELLMGRAAAQRAGLDGPGGGLAARAVAASLAATPQYVRVGHAQLVMREAGRTTLDVPLTREARRKLRRLPRIELLLRSELRDEAGDLQRTLNRRLVFERDRDPGSAAVPPDGGVADPADPAAVPAGQAPATEAPAQPGGDADAGAPVPAPVPSAPAPSPPSTATPPAASSPARPGTSWWPWLALAAGGLAATGIALALRRRGSRR